MWAEALLHHEDCYYFVQDNAFNLPNFCIQALSHTHVDVTNSDEKTKADVSR